MALIATLIKHPDIIRRGMLHLLKLIEHSLRVESHLMQGDVIAAGIGLQQGIFGSCWPFGLPTLPGFTTCTPST